MRKMNALGKLPSSANSINFGRLVPQVVYYFSSYAQLVCHGKIRMGQPLNFVVPTGNFGDILAGYYAKRMGLPIGKLICASNRNNVLSDFFTDGVYYTHRTFFKTMSPSMDILISSNLERLLYESAGRDAERCEFVDGVAQGKRQLLHRRAAAAASCSRRFPPALPTI